MTKKYLVLTNCKEGEPEFEGVFNTRKEAILYVAFETNKFLYDPVERREAVENLINKVPAGDRSYNFHIVGIDSKKLEPTHVGISKKNAKTAAFIDVQFAKKAEERRDYLARINESDEEDSSEEEPAPRVKPAPGKTKGGFRSVPTKE
jgi:hypothetical protein